MSMDAGTTRAPSKRKEKKKRAKGKWMTTYCTSSYRFVSAQYCKYAQDLVLHALQALNHEWEGKERGGKREKI
jgi:uncharacterized iron-regulated protein